LQENRPGRPNFRQIQTQQFPQFSLPNNRFGIFHGRPGEWLCLHRSLTVAETIDTLRSEGLFPFEHRKIQFPRGTRRMVTTNAALAMELCILTAARSGEILGMRWPEIDFDKKIWTVPAARMKAAREHRVPLSPRPVVILRQLEKLQTGEFVFAGQAHTTPLSNMADGNGVAPDED
jgi:integrase